MLKNSLRALIVVTAFAVPCVSFGAQIAGPGMPSPDPVFKPGKFAGPGMPSPDPVFKPGKFAGPGMPSPDPVFKPGKGK